MDKLTLLSLVLGIVGAAVALIVLIFAPGIRASKATSGNVSRLSIGLAGAATLVSALAGLLGTLGVGIKPAAPPTITTNEPPRPASSPSSISLSPGTSASAIVVVPPEPKTISLGQINQVVSPNFGSLGGAERSFVDVFPAPTGYRILAARLQERSASKASYTIVVSPEAVRVHYSVRAGSAIDQYRGWLDADVIATIEKLNP